MNRQVLSMLWPLIVLNVLAVGLWLASSRWRVVLINPLGRGLRELGSGGSERLRGAMQGVVARTASAARSLKALGKLKVVSRPAAQADGLDAWIDEVEQQETRVTEQRPAPAPETAAATVDGSADWWRAFAESGGALPGAAESCRRPSAATDRKVANL